MRYFVLAIPFAALSVAQDAMEILRNVEEKYKSLDSYQAVIKTVSENKFPTGQSRHEQEVRYSYKRPGKNRSENLAPSMNPMEHSSDGDFYYTLSRQTKEYIKRPATRRPEGPIAENRVSKLSENTESAAILRNEELLVDGKPMQCWVIERKPKAQPGSDRMKVLSSEWWIAKDSYLLLKLIEHREFTMPFSGKQLSTGTTTWAGIRLNPELADDLFVFTPPEGFKEVSNFSMPGVTRKGKLEGQPAPPFFLKDTLGRDHSLDALKGKVVLVNFWATWCAPCRAEMPFIELLHRSFKEKGLVVLGVDDEEAKVAQEYLEKNRYSFPSLVDTEKQVTNAYGVEGVPTTFLIDREGKVVMTGIGSMGNADLKDQLEKLGIW